MANDDPHDPMMLPTPDRPRRATAPHRQLGRYCFAPWRCSASWAWSCKGYGFERPEPIARFD